MLAQHQDASQCMNAQSCVYIKYLLLASSTLERVNVMTCSLHRWMFPLFFQLRFDSLTNFLVVVAFTFLQ